MKIIKLSQTEDREAWLEARRGLITGSKARKVKPLSRGTDRTPAGFWEILAEKISIAKDGEPDMDRGHRLEVEAIEIAGNKLELDFDTDCGMWVSDENASIAVSPDGSEKSDNPTFAAEAKCLSSGNHLKYLVKDLRARKSDSYRAIDSIPNEATSAYREQVIQYFVVNKDLKVLYFVLYDDRIAYEHLTHHIITIFRDEIENDIEAQIANEEETINQINDLLKELLNE